MVVSLVFAAGLTAGGHALGAPAVPDLVVYDDVLASGWQDWSWSTTDNLANASPALGGTGHSIAVTITAAWGGFSLRAPTPIATGGYSAIRFWAYGAPGGSALTAYIQSSDGGAASPGLDFSAPAGVWMPFTVTLATLGNPSFIQRVDIQDRTGSAQPVFSLDDIRLLGVPSVATATIEIDGAAAGAPLNPHLIGSNLPAWLGPGTLADPVFQTRTAAAGINMLRIPGGSWSDDYG